MEILNAKWITDENENLLIKYLDKDKNEHSVVPKINPYFFVAKSDCDKAMSVIKKFCEQKIQGSNNKNIKNSNVNENLEVEIDKSDWDNYITLDQKPAVKIEVPYPSHVKDLVILLEKSGVQTYESDIPFVKRWMIDEDISPAVENISKCYFDIEIDSRKEFPNPENPFQRILTIALVDDKGKELVFCDNDEFTIINNFWKTVKEKYCYLTGWNIANFDIPYFINRSQKYFKLKIDDYYFQWLDSMKLYKIFKWGQLKTAKLQNVSMEELGIGKKQEFAEEVKVHVLWRMFQENKQELMEYCLQDCRLVKELDQKLLLSDVNFKVAKIAGTLINDSIYLSRIVEMLLLKAAQKRSPRIVFYNRRTYEKAEEIPGGYIVEPKPGFYRNVIVFDFVSLYNRIIQTFNIGHENVAEKYIPGETIKTENLVFRRLPKSLSVEILQQLEILRNEYKKLRDKCERDSLDWKNYEAAQTSIKRILLSFYGLSGQRGLKGQKTSRLYNPEIAKSITLTGQEVLKTLIKIINDLNVFELIYGDTDSIMIRFNHSKYDNPEIIEKNIYKLTQHFNQKLKEQLCQRYDVPPENYKIELSPRNIFTFFFIPAKKRYFGHSIWTEGKKEDRDVFVGLEHKRYDVFNLLRIVQETTLKIIMNSKTNAEIKSKLREYLINLKRDLFDGKYDRELVFMRNVRQSFEKYKVLPPHVQAAKILAEKGVFRGGDTVKYIITDLQNGHQIAEPVLESGIYPKIKPNGYKYYWEYILRLVESLIGENIFENKLEGYFEEEIKIELT